MSRFIPVLALTMSLLACGGDEPPTPTPSPPQTPAIDEILARHQVEWDATERDAAIAAGQEAIVRHECNRCHTIDDIDAAGRSDHCTSCHQWLKGIEPGHRHYEMLSTRYGEETLLRYQRNIEHYQLVPDLTRIASRLDPDWIREFIADPYDLRPMMPETMVRTHLPDADRQAIARYFAAVAGVADPAQPHASRRLPPAPSRTQLERGKQLFLTRGCTTCHTFGNLDTRKTEQDLASVGMPAQLAPNLRFARDRMRRDVMIAWIEQPNLLVEGTLMPDLNLTHEEANLIADFLLYEDPHLHEPPAIPSLEPPVAVERPVSWAEVKEKVLGRICVHCHMNDHERDLGPGNEGGFGWAGNELAMRTYEMLVRGALDRQSGEHYSVLEPRPGRDHSPLIEVMMSRRIEERRDRVEVFRDSARPEHVAERPGMPMGLPSIPDDEVALVRAWIDQGCPGPTEVTGMPGISDGFLVPDGPITTNQGCELRAPSEHRPDWSTQPPPEWALPTMAPTNSAMATPNMR